MGDSGEKMTLYWGSGSPPCWRVMIALEEKGLSKYKSKLLSFEKKEHKSEEVLKLNPRGQMPTFQDGELIINEHYAILQHLAMKYKGKGTPFFPEDEKAKAQVLQRYYEIPNLQKCLTEGVVFYKLRTKPEDIDSSVLEEKLKSARTELGVWEKYLEQGKAAGCNFLAGKDFSIADIELFPMLAIGFRFGLSKDKFPQLCAYYNRLKDRPSIQKSWPPHWKDSAPGEKFATALSDV